MNNIPQRLRKEIDRDPQYKICSLKGHGTCSGRITMEHTLIYAGRQIQEKWSIIPLCALHHEVDFFQDAHTMEKEKNVWVALNRATDDELIKYSKAVNYLRERRRLNEKYGLYVSPPLPVNVHDLSPLPLF